MGRDLFASGWSLASEGWARPSDFQGFSSRDHSKTSSFSAAAFVDGLLAADPPFSQKLGRGFLKELNLLARERDAEMFFAGLLALGGRLEAAGKIEPALALYSALVQGGPLSLLAQHRLDALQGRGHFGRRAEVLIGDFSNAATDYRVIAPMIAGSMVYQIAKTVTFTRLAATARATWMTRGLGARFTSSLAGFLFEVPAFSLASRGLMGMSGEEISWNGDAMSRDLLGATLTLGVLKVSGWAGQKVGAGLAPARVQGVSISAGPARLAGFLAGGQPQGSPLQFLIPQASMFVGMLGAHKLEEAAGLRPHVDGATAVTETLGTMLSLGVGLRLGQKLLGTRFASFQAELDFRSRQSPDEAKAGGFSYPPYFQPQLAHFPSAPSRLAPKPLPTAPILLFELRGESNNPPRDYQRKMLDSLERDIRERKHPWLALISPMQTGKSYLIGPILERLQRHFPKNTRYIILSPARVITDQVVSDLVRGFPTEEIGRFDGTRKDPKRITVASLISLARRLEEFPANRPTVLIHDEAFLTQSKSSRNILKHFGLATGIEEAGLERISPKSGKGLLIGFSGTGAGTARYHTSAELDLLTAIEAGWVRGMVGERVRMKISHQKKRSFQEGKMIWWRPTRKNAKALVDLYHQKIFGKYDRPLIYVPTIQHGELFLQALRRKYGTDHGLLVHSEMKEDFESTLQTWREGNTPLISVRRLGRGFRGTGAGAVFHTYQTTSLELFAQRTGRAWGRFQATLPDLYVLEASWSLHATFANLPRAVGLADYPARRFRTRGIRKTVESIRSRRPLEEERGRKISTGEVNPLFAEVPLLVKWRDLFRRAMKKAGGLEAMAQKTGTPSDILAGFALGSLPLQSDQVRGLQGYLGGESKILKIWVKAWEQIVDEVSRGARKLEGRLNELIRWRKRKGTASAKAQALDLILAGHFFHPSSEPKYPLGMEGLIARLRHKAGPAPTDEDLGALLHLGAMHILKETKNEWFKVIFEKMILATPPATFRQLADQLKVHPVRLWNLYESFVRRIVLETFWDYLLPLNIHDFPIDRAGFSRSTVRALRLGGIRKVKDLVSLVVEFPKDFPRRKNLRVQHVLEIQRFLDLKGFAPWEQGGTARQNFAARNSAKHRLLQEAIRLTTSRFGQPLLPQQTGIPGVPIQNRENSFLNQWLAGKELKQSRFPLFRKYQEIRSLLIGLGKDPGETLDLLRAAAFEERGWKWNASTATEGLLLAARKAAAEQYGGILPYPWFRSDFINIWLEEGKMVTYHQTFGPQDFYRQVADLLLELDLEPQEIDSLVVEAALEELQAYHAAITQGELGPDNPQFPGRIPDELEGIVVEFGGDLPGRMVPEWETHLPSEEYTAFPSLDNFYFANIRSRLQTALNSLPPRLQKVLAMRYELEGESQPSFRELGESFGISKERMRQIQMQGLHSLRKILAPEEPAEPTRKLDLNPNKKFTLYFGQGKSFTLVPFSSGEMYDPRASFSGPVRFSKDSHGTFSIQLEEFRFANEVWFERDGNWVRLPSTLHKSFTPGEKIKIRRGDREYFLHTEATDNPNILIITVSDF